MGITVASVRHWHVFDSMPGCLPESQPYVTDSADLAADWLGHLIDDWAASHHNEPSSLDPGELARARRLAAHYCQCLEDGAQAGPARPLAGSDVCEYVGNRVFEAVSCRDHDCLKYCPDPECGTAVPIGDTDDRCWCCGARYIAANDCAWIG